MTAISTIITKLCTVHACDSMLTRKAACGSLETVSTTQHKTVQVRAFSGAMSYWGLASCEEKKWSTYDWLKERGNHAREHDSAEGFARSLAEGLNKNIQNMNLASSLDCGIGIHLTVYERIQDYQIPELFLISNWADTNYSSLNPGGVQVSRETYGMLEGEARKPEHRSDQYRLKVHGRLQAGAMLMFNNGNTKLFNPAAKAILEMIDELRKARNFLRTEEVKTYCDIARRPLEIVSKVQQDFCREGTRAVGGRIHDLAITPSGDYFSTSDNIS